MNMATNLLQIVLVVAIAPLVRGTIARIKARVQNRRGASLWRPYVDLAKLFRKQDLKPTSASPMFFLAPRVIFAATVGATAFVPVVVSGAAISFAGDFLVLVYLLALARFFLLLGAMDGGGAFGGMGASREVLVSALAEAPLVLSLASVAIAAGSMSLSGMAQWAAMQEPTKFSAVHALALSAMVVVAIAETGRIPVDNPTTHLELTMIHEAMVLEYSGPSLAWIEWAAAVKLTLILSLLVAMFAPWGMALGTGAVALLVGAAAFAGKLGVLAAAIAVLECSTAKLRMYLVPDFLGVAAALSVLAVVFTAVLR